jgi:PadR family transcriptional regulator, regulatory protein PadR
MRLMSRSEELVLLAVWKLRDDAHCVPIREHLGTMTGKNWSLGSIFDPLDRLEKKGLLRSTLTGPEKYQGGRSKRVYRITPFGKKALAELYKIHEAMWADAADLKAETGKA